jgi:glycosyltransferase involved in cell wall biosynthesis
VTLSAEQRDEITTRFAIAPADKVTVIAAGHDLSRLLAMPAGAAGGRADFGWSDRHVVMGYVGRLVAIKDLTTLVAAFAAVARTRDDVRLLIAGDGGERERLERLASDLGVRAAVAFAGWQTDLARLYATIDIVLLTSRNEGMPASLIEGMAAARAVVATRVGGVPELVADGQTGVLVSPGDIAAIADAMARLADNPALRRSLGEAARRAIGERFGPTRFAGDTLRFYHHVLEKRRGL